MRARLIDSIETSFHEGEGSAFAVEVDEAGAVVRTHRFSERFECRTCGIPYEIPQPRLFSFNNPFGACPSCHGFGNVIELDMALVVPDPAKSLNDGAIEPWTKPHYRSCLAQLKRAAKGGQRASRCALAGSDTPRSSSSWSGQETLERTMSPKGSTACAGSSAASSARSTRCTSACSSAAIAAT